MGLIAGVLEGVLCVILYVRMCKREVPEPMGKKAAIPVVLGLFSPILSTILLAVFALAVMQITGGQSQSLTSQIPTYTLRSLFAAFLGAAFPEELVKFLFLLLSARIIKPKNVYEYGLLGAGVGTGFTFLEQMLYGGQNIVNSLVRLPFFAMHVAFDLIMGVLLGLAMYKRHSGRGGDKKYVILAFVVPVLWHTIFDAATTFNKALQAELDADNKLVTYVGAAAALIVIIVSVALQVWGLVKYKKETEELCAMETSSQPSRPRHIKSEQ